LDDLASVNRIFPVMSVKVLLGLVTHVNPLSGTQRILIANSIVSLLLY